MKTKLTTKQAHQMVSRYRAKAEGDVEEITGLNITAMMDMMTILMVFLLKQFAVTSGAITPSSSDITLPKSLSSEPPANYLVVTITRKAVLVEGQSVVTLQNGKIPNTAKTSADSYEVKDLKDALNLFGQVFEAKAKDAGKPYERQMLLVADKDTPYLVVASVVATAGAAKFLKFQMVVVSTTSG
jgi:biopolymer transport protein ExbD